MARKFFAARVGGNGSLTIKVMESPSLPREITDVGNPAATRTHRLLLLHIYLSLRHGGGSRTESVVLTAPLAA